MINIPDNYVEETLQRVIDSYIETIGRGDAKSLTHTMDILALQEALCIVRAYHNAHNTIRR